MLEQSTPTRPHIRTECRGAPSHGRPPEANAAAHHPSAPPGRVEGKRAQRNAPAQGPWQRRCATEYGAATATATAGAARRQPTASATANRPPTGHQRPRAQPAGTDRPPAAAPGEGAPTTRGREPWRAPSGGAKSDPGKLRSGKGDAGSGPRRPAAAHERGSRAGGKGEERKGGEGGANRASFSSAAGRRRLASRRWRPPESGKGRWLAGRGFALEPPGKATRGREDVPSLGITC